MGSKRPLADDAGDGGGESSNQQPKRRKFYGSGKHKAKEGTSEFAKKRVRNIQRLLQSKADLPANVRNDLERELAALRSDVADRAFQKKRSAMIAKYHMVRFFERKKASRLVKQLRRQIEADPNGDDAASLKEQLHVAEVDEAYTLYHPHIEPYISLYGNAKPADGDDETADKAPAAKLALKAERPPMWAEVEKTMEQGLEALQRLRERRSADGSTPAPRRPTLKKSSGANKTPLKPRQEQGQEQNHETHPKAQHGDKHKPAGAGERSSKTALNRRERRRLMRETMAAEEDADSDGGGFFEEA
ncbi:rRNA-processing protein efg1 [Purpureocillium takamizusanense]|uniref:rRNA-processing protein EFG1 n=1 Tax=Purpureocillium takamizusanense TaxID=2060973 RepID=A0A9Q8V641_9HYPO|nr:rRNA-processing protein efg1 [Purpureocillium takamizusanense]UNI14343.1 rRNA-processing protein efg1 [Purpureocillium takamizusanense]